MLLRLTLALAVVVGAAAAMKASQAAEDTPYIGVYEANVTDMEGYKANFLTPLQPKLDADIQERWTGKTTERVGKAPENRVVIGLYPSKAKLDAFWNESKEIFKIGQKYSTGMRFFAAPAMMPLPALANNQTFEIYEAAVSDENGYKNDFLKAIEPEATEAQDRVLGARLQYRRGTDRRGAEEPHRHQRLAERGSRAKLLERH